MGLISIAVIHMAIKCNFFLKFHTVISKELVHPLPLYMYVTFRLVGWLKGRRQIPLFAYYLLQSDQEFAFVEKWSDELTVYQHSVSCRLECETGGFESFSCEICILLIKQGK